MTADYESITSLNVNLIKNANLDINYIYCNFLQLQKISKK